MIIENIENFKTSKSLILSFTYSKYCECMIECKKSLDKCKVLKLSYLTRNSGGGENSSSILRFIYIGVILIIGGVSLAINVAHFVITVILVAFAILLLLTFVSFNKNTEVSIFPSDDIMKEMNVLYGKATKNLLHVYPYPNALERYTSYFETLPQITSLGSVNVCAQDKSNFLNTAFGFEFDNPLREVYHFEKDRRFSINTALLEFFINYQVTNNSTKMRTQDISVLVNEAGFPPGDYRMLLNSDGICTIFPKILIELEQSYLTASIDKDLVSYELCDNTYGALFSNESEIEDEGGIEEPLGDISGGESTLSQVSHPQSMVTLITFFDATSHSKVCVIGHSNLYDTLNIVCPHKQATRVMEKLQAGADMSDENTNKMKNLEYDLLIGNITQEEYNRQAALILESMQQQQVSEE